MASSSNVPNPIPTFAGQDFQSWSKKVEEYLVEEGLWYVIEEGYEMPSELRNDEEMREHREHMANVTFTLSLLHKALSPKILSEVRRERNAKAAWDFLQLMYNTMNDPPCTSESSESSEPMRRTEENEKFSNKRKFNERPASLKVGTSTRSMSVIEKVNGKRKINEPTPSNANPVRFDIGSDHEDSLESGDDPPASWDMPRHPCSLHWDCFLSDRAVKPKYKLYLPSSLPLPSTDRVAIVRSTQLNKEYKMGFCGKLRRFGVSTWRKFIEDHKLREGHRLKFKVVECSQFNFVIEVSTYSISTKRNEGPDDEDEGSDDD